MAVVGYFPATLAVDSNTGTRLRNAEAQVFAMTDTSFTTPLAITDVAGVPFTGNKLVSNSDGIYPEFKPPAGVTQVIVKSGQALTPMTSIAVAAEAAEAAAVQAASAATDAGNAKTDAVQAKNDAVVARQAAEAVGATTDAQMTAVQASPTSAFSVAQKATFVSLAAAAKNPDLLIVGNITRDANQAVTSADVVWPDGKPGTFTALTLSTAFPGAVDGYKITYGSPVTKTYTQPAITRNAAGAATTVPQIVVS
ncbi:hypothetical protein J2X55_002244 [Microbacterium sp. 1154]|uniref:hypothetical protein n=1 Tax=Microbacterium sp. 1154 TaxID=2817733 RepID=UPI002860F032|nr:hypothetical protein [Microbacterium sp. 1154]MDR6691332.1 hypothetical protein [Microbacterium sp. 1154]